MANNEEVLTEIKNRHEAKLTESIERELTDEQLVQLAEGDSSWGCNCDTNEGCGGGAVPKRM